MPDYASIGRDTKFSKMLEGSLAIRYDPAIPINPLSSRGLAPVSVAEPSPAKARKADNKAGDAEVITARQIRAGRALLGWTQEELAKVAKIGRATLARIEADMTNPGADTLKAIRKALMSNGVRLFDDSDGIGEGARMAKPEESE